MKTFFFDLDGTLADTDGDIRASWKAALADLHVECPNFDRDFVAGPPLEDMAKRMMPEVYTDEFGKALRASFGFHYDNDGFPNTFEYPGVLDMVRSLKSSGARVFIVTNKRYSGASAMAAKFGWNDIFEKLYTGDMHDDNPAIGRMNKTDLIKFVLAEQNLAAADCVMVGDTINDFSAARANGVESVAVSWGYGEAKDLALADKLIERPEEILALYSAE